MKKLRTIITVMIFSLVGFSFAGCDDDDFEDFFEGFEDIGEADALYGTWEGYLGTFYYDRWGVGGDDYITTIRFDKPLRGSASGRGYEVDRYMDDPRNYYYCEFSWMISRGEIVIIYDDAIYEPVYIYDYRLTRNRFSGYMDDGTNKEIKFDFRYVSHFDWGIYFNSPMYGAKNAPEQKDNAEK